jgi:hypothetical protein
MESVTKRSLAKQLNINIKYLDDMERLLNANKEHNRSICKFTTFKDFQKRLKAINLL